jgi:NitT/TauT family transport system substrate-binding protein
MKTAVKLFLFLWVAQLALAREAKPDDTIRIGIISAVFGYAPVFVAKERGFFKREGLYPEIILITRNENIVSALVADSLQFGNVPPNLLLSMHQQGFNEIKMIAGSFNGTTYSLIALPKHKRIEDLKGGKLGMSGFTSAGTMMMKQLIKDRGLVYPRDYTFVSIGNGSAGLFQALQAGQIDAALLAQPLSLIAIEQGFSNLVDGYKVMPEYQLSAIGVREGWAQKNRGIVVRYLKALVGTYRWLHDNRDEAIKILGPITKLDRKYIPASWDTYTKTQIWPRNGEVSTKGVQTLLNLMAEEGTLKKPLPKVEDIIATSYLEEARKALGQ